MNDPILKTILQKRLDSLNDSLKKNHIKISFDKKISEDLEKVLLCSEFVAVNMINHPNLLKKLLESKDLAKSYGLQTYQEKIKKNISENLALSQLKNRLRELHRYEIIRIAWRDLTGASHLGETLQDLSSLAEAVVEAAIKANHEDLIQTYGVPKNREGKIQKMTVLGMGKLGAKELNFSSDIDLVFVYPEAGYTHGEKSISNEEFFTRLCRNFLKFFSVHEHEGNFYRVDIRLRPYGESGPVVMSAAAFEEYYQAQGREWERYAMIKARPVAGDKQEGARILRILNPFVFRRYFDYGSFDSFREMKHRILLQIKNKKLKNNIKLGAGGIREIEFFVQLFQLIRGGVEPRLQEPGVLKVIDLLVEHQCIQSDTCDNLKQAYIFLRMVENRLQEYADLQTHDIPENNDQRKILSCSMGYTKWQDFEMELKNHMQRVHGYFNQLLVSGCPEAEDKDMQKINEFWMNINDSMLLENIGPLAGFHQPGRLRSILKSLEEHPNTRHLTANGRKKLNILIPELVRKAGKQENPEGLLVKLVDLIIIIERRTCYLSLLIEKKAALDNLINLAQKSPWIIGFISKHPVLLDELMHPDSLYVPPDRKALEKQMEIRMSAIASDSLEVLIEEICVFRQISMLRVSAADVSGNYPLMKVSDHLTYIAEIVLARVVEISWDIVTRKYGTPEGILRAGIKTCGFAVIAYGKLGGIEMGYASDIDLVFLYQTDPGMTGGGEKRIENIRFYTNLAQRIIHILTLHTAAGVLYGADMRLRPGGSSGTIVSHIDAYEEYLTSQAWTWEHQALVRARFVSGDIRLGNRFDKIRTAVLSRKRDPVALRKEVTDMREKLRKDRLKYMKGYFDIKQAKGGVVDIEFLVQYLVLSQAHQYPDLVAWTDKVRLLEGLALKGVISVKEKQLLEQTYISFRRMIHRLNLQEKPLFLPENQFSEMKKNVSRIYDRFLEG